MAQAAQGLEDGLTNCPICFERYKTPKYLPCLHTFCEECIQNYIVSVLSKQDAPSGKINCPICRCVVSKPDGIEKEQWGKHLPSNHLIISIMDSQRLKEHQMCNACERENESESASRWCVDCRDFLCEKCASTHRKYRNSIDHNIVGLTEVGDTFVLSDSAPCGKHSDKKLEAFCSDHNVACCIICVTIEHRKCDKVGTVADAAKGLRSSPLVKGLEKSFSEMGTELHSLAQEKQQNITEFRNSSDKVKKQVKEMCARAHSHLEDIESKTLEELSAMEKEVIPELESMRDEMECQRSVATNNLTILQHGLQYASDAQFLNEIQKLKEQKSRLEVGVKNAMKSQKNIELRYSPSKELLDFAKSVNCCGTINAVRESDLPSIDTLNGTAKLLRSFDTGLSFFTGGLILEDDRVLIANYSSFKLELYSKQGQLLSALLVGGLCWSVEMLGSSDAGVATVYNNNLIIFFKIDCNGRIIETSRKNLDRHCYDIRYFDNKLYITCDSKLLILDIKGNILESLDTITPECRFLDIDSNKICYATNKGNELRSISFRKPNGELFRYTAGNLHTTAGVAVDFAGNVYVAGFHPGNIHQLDKNGSFKKILVTGLSQVLALRFKQNSNIFLTNSDGKAMIYEIT